MDSVGAVLDEIRSSGLFSKTPLLYSSPLSTLLGRDVYLKLDCLQPSGSFKDRGVAYLCWTYQKTKGITKVITSSGGNAGLAVANVAKPLGLDVIVIVPETTKPLVIDRLRNLGAAVLVHGAHWNEADEYTRILVSQDPHATYVSPYDHPLLWTGHSTLVDEILEDLPDPTTMKPAAVIVSVGGGGLLCGVLEGLERHGLQSHTAVVGVETDGTSSFAQAWQHQRVVRLPSISGIATSLAALEVTGAAIERAQNHEKAGGRILALSCTDAEAVYACWQFAHDHRMLVEPACGAALAPIYCDRLRGTGWCGTVPPTGPIVVEICGGSGVNIELLVQWRNDLGLNRVES